MIVCLSGRGDKDVVQVRNAWKWSGSKRRYPWLKHSLSILKTIRKAGRIFLPYIMAGDHEKGLTSLPETISFLESLGVSAIEKSVCLFQILLQRWAGYWSRSEARPPCFSQVFSRKLAEVGHSAASHDLLPIPVTSAVSKICQDLARTPVKDLIIPDLPYEHRTLSLPLLEDSDIALIPLVGLTTGPIERQQRADQEAEVLSTL